MHSHNHCENRSLCNAGIQESRSSHRNLPVSHPSRWRLLSELLLSSPMRLHRYRNLSVRMLEETLKTLDDGDHR